MLDLKCVSLIIQCNVVINKGLIDICGLNIYKNSWHFNWFKHKLSLTSLTWLAPANNYIAVAVFIALGVIETITWSIPSAKGW